MAAANANMYRVGGKFATIVYNVCSGYPVINK